MVKIVTFWLVRSFRTVNGWEASKPIGWELYRWFVVQHHLRSEWDIQQAKQQHKSVYTSRLEQHHSVTKTMVLPDNHRIASGCDNTCAGYLPVVCVCVITTTRHMPVQLLEPTQQISLYCKWPRASDWFVADCCWVEIIFQFLSEGNCSQL